MKSRGAGEEQPRGRGGRDQGLPNPTRKEKSGIREKIRHLRHRISTPLNFYFGQFLK